MLDQLHRTGPIRAHLQRDGWHIIADLTAAGFSGWFKPSLSHRMQTRIGIGAVEGIIPLVNNTQVTLDGRDAGGKIVPVPPLDLVIGPNADLRSWLCLQVTVNAKGELDPKNRESAIVGHLNDLTGRYQNGFSPDQDGRGYLPLAMILWKDKTTPQRFVRNVYFNQRHSFRPAAKKGGKAAHFFYPAA